MFLGCPSVQLSIKFCHRETCLVSFELINTKSVSGSYSGQV